MTAIARLAAILLALAASAARAADPAWYTKKATWEATRQASRDAFDQARKAAPPVAPLPDFGRGDFTIAAWLRTTKGGTIVAKAPATGNWAPQGKALFVRGGRLCYDIGWVGTLASQRRVADGAWHHVALTSKAGALRLHIDGQPDKAGRLAAKPDVPAHVLKLGFTCPNFPRQGSGLRGALDDVRLYRRALPPGELRALAAGQPPAKPTGLVAHWPLDDGLRDASGHHHHAAPAGKPATTPGKHGRALQLDGRAHAVVRGQPTFADLVWPLLERDFGVVRLFDGTSLDGWHRRNRPGHGWGSVWAAADGAIDGVQEWPGALGLIATRRAFASFDLQLEVKTDWPVDSAVLLRLAGFADGPQVTIHCRPDGDVGGIATGETAEPRVAAKGWKKLWKKDDWNQLRIRVEAQPPTIRTWLNGAPVATYTHPTAEPLAPRAPIALKIHGGDDAFNNHACFRNLHLRQLK